MPTTFSPMVRPRSGKRRADRQPLPVVLGDIRRADPGDDPGVAELDAPIVPEDDLQIHRREDGLVAVGFDAVGPDGGAHDVEVRVIDRVGLFGGGGDHAEGLRVDDLVAAIGGLADLAHADAAVDTGDAHPGTGGDGTLGAVLGQRGGRTIDSGKRDGHGLHTSAG